MRGFFFATPIDDTPPLSTPTHEIIEAKWLTLDEVMAIPKQKLRSREVQDILKWVDNGATVHPLSLFEGTDQEEKDHAVVLTELSYTSTTIIRHNDKFCFVKNGNSWRIPFKLMDSPQAFSTVAQGT